MIWQNPETGSEAEPELGPGAGEVSGVCMVGRLADLGQALAVLDATDPETDSISFDKATDHLITIARHVVTAARPILDHPGALGAAVEDAMADRRDIPGSCRDCAHAETGMCGDHTDDLAQADIYATLLPALTHRAEPEPEPGPVSV